MQSYGQPALVKLLNNALGTYNLAATARMLNLAAQLGVAAKGLFEVIGVSTGKSWMSDNFIDVQYDLLLKDVDLLRGEIGSLPAADLNDGIEGDPSSACAVAFGFYNPLSYFEPDSNERWADGVWLTPSGRYTVHVGTSSADTPLEATVVLSSRRDRTPVDVDAPTPRPREGGGDDEAFRVDPRRE